MPIEFIYIISLFGVLTGCLSGLLGIGGGILLAPLLIIFYPLIAGNSLDILTITGLTVAQSFFGSASAMFHFRKKSEFSRDLVVKFGVPMGVASFCISFYVEHISESWVFIILGSLGAFSVLITVLPKNWLEILPIGQYRKVSLPAMGVLLGLLCGAAGQGGGFVYLPVLIYLLSQNTRTAICTAPIIGILSSVGLFFGRAMGDSMDWISCIALVVGILIGSKMGALISFKLNEEVLKKIVNGFVLLSAIKIISMAI